MATPANHTDLLSDTGRLSVWWGVLPTVCSLQWFIPRLKSANAERLWRTLILRRWYLILAYLPVETVIRSRQDAYYASLAESDQAGEATPFILFMLAALKDVPSLTAWDRLKEGVNRPL